jgi:hypothetical protein
MVSGRLSFNQGDDCTDVDALDRLSIKELYPAGLLRTQQKGQKVQCWIGKSWEIGQGIFPPGFLTRIFHEISGSRLIFFSLG